MQRMKKCTDSVNKWEKISKKKCKRSSLCISQQKHRSILGTLLSFLDYLSTVELCKLPLFAYSTGHSFIATRQTNAKKNAKSAKRKSKKHKSKWRKRPSTTTDKRCSNTKRMLVGKSCICSAWWNHWVSKHKLRLVRLVKQKNQIG